MNKLVNRIFATAIISSALLSSAVMAAQKIGVINAEAVLQQMPQAISSQQTLNIEFKDEGAEVEAMRQTIAKDFEELKKNAPTMSDAQIKAAEDRLNAARVKFEEKAKPLQERMQARRQEENNKVLSVLQRAIQEVAEEEKYDLILNSNSAIYVKPEHNVSEKILKRVSSYK